jgi:hypothetical protein
MMRENPLHNAEQFETIAVVLLGIVILLTLEPISQIRLICAGILAGLVIVFTGVSIWHWRHDNH